MTSVIKTTIMCGLFFVGALSAKENFDIDNIIAVMETETPVSAYVAVKQMYDIVLSGDYDKLPANQKNRLVLAFNHQLKKGRIVAEKGETEEAFAHVSVLGAIAGKLKKSSMIPILVEGVGNASYADALLKIGEPSIDPLLKKMWEGDVSEKNAIAEIFKNMGVNTLKGKRVIVQNALLKMCAHKRKSVRISAVRALAEVGDEGAVLVLERIGESDPEFDEVNSSTSSIYRKYRVREEAARALKRVRERTNAESQQLQHSTTTQGIISQ